MHTRYFRRNDLVPWSAADYDQALLHPSLHRHPHVVLLLQELRKWLTNAPDGGVRGFKETLLHEKLDWLSSYLPELRVIHLVRDPRAITASVLAVPEAEELWQYRDSVPRYLSGQGSSLGGIPATDPARLDLFELCLRSIGIRWELAQEGLPLFRHVTVRLEDLVEQPRQALEPVMDLLGLQPVEAQLRFAADTQRVSRGGRYSSYRSREAVLRSWRRRLTEEQQWHASNVLEPFIQEYGYAC